MSIGETGTLTKHYSLEKLREKVDVEHCFVCKKLCPDIQFDTIDNNKVYICGRKCFLKFQVYKSARLESIKKNCELVLQQNKNNGILNQVKNALKLT